MTETVGDIVPVFPSRDSEGVMVSVAPTIVLSVDTSRDFVTTGVIDAELECDIVLDLLGVGSLESESVAERVG